jgi:hypothetical protein
MAGVTRADQRGARLFARQVEFSDLIDVAMPSEETIDVFSWLGFSFIYFTTIAVMLGGVQWS